MSENFLEVRFNFFDFWFKPYKGSKSLNSSEKILKACIEEINHQKLHEGKAIVIDKYEGRKGKERRNHFISSAAYSHTEKRYKCRINLIRDSKLPHVLNKSNFSLTPLQNLGHNAIAETTNFYIDISQKMPIVCCEFNYDGPRITDIEYYFRQIASKNLKIATACRARVHMKMPVNDVLESISDVLKFEIKVKPNRLAFLNHQVNDAFVGNMSALANSVDPQSIKVDAFFRERGNSSTSKRNLKALSFIKRALKAIKADNNIIEDFDDFTLEFEKTDGTEDTFNLIKGKEEIVIECPTKKSGALDTKKLYELISLKFDEYLELNK